MKIDPMLRASAARILASDAADFHKLGWMWGTSGNLSQQLQRDPLIYLMTCSGCSKGELTESDMILVEGSGTPLEAWSWSGRPSAETVVHGRIYQRFEADAVYHVHTIMGTVLSECYADRGGIDLSGLEMLKGLGHPTPDVSLRIPIVDNDADSDRIADNVEKGVQPGVPGVLVRNHGLYAWGKSPAEARARVEVFESLFSYVYHRDLLRAALRAAP